MIDAVGYEKNEISNKGNKRYKENPFVITFYRNRKEYKNRGTGEYPQRNQTNKINFTKWSHAVRSIYSCVPSFTSDSDAALTTGAAIVVGCNALLTETFDVFKTN